MITVYSKPSCVQCNAVFRHLDKAGVDYDVRSLLDEPEKLLELKESGHMAAPVVESSTRPTFAGFNPSKLNEIIADEREGAAAGEDLDSFDCGKDDCCGGMEWPECHDTRSTVPVVNIEGEQVGFMDLASGVRA